MIKIFLTNLGKYNEGDLIGEWLELPFTDDELAAVKRKIGISSKADKHGRYYEEWFITDYETDIDNFKIDEFADLDSLNELAETIETLDKYSREIVEALLSKGYELEDALEKKDDCMVYCDCDDMTDVAEKYTEEIGLLDKIPEDLRYYFDFEAYGRDMSFSGQFIFTKNGNCVQIL